MPSHIPDTMLVCLNSQCDFQSESWKVSEEVCPTCGADLEEVGPRPQRMPRVARPQRRLMADRERLSRTPKIHHRSRERNDG